MNESKPTNEAANPGSRFTMRELWEASFRKKPEEQAKALSDLWPVGPDGKREGEKPLAFTIKADLLQTHRDAFFSAVKEQPKALSDLHILEAIIVNDTLNGKPGATENAIALAEALLAKPEVKEAIGGEEAAKKAMNAVKVMNVADFTPPLGVIAGGQYSNDEFKKYVAPRHEHAATNYTDLGGDPAIAAVLREVRSFRLDEKQEPSKIAQFVFTVHSVCGVAAKDFCHVDKDITKDIVPEMVVNATRGNLEKKDRETGAVQGFVHKDLFAAVGSACLQADFLNNTVRHKRENKLFSRDSTLEERKVQENSVALQSPASDTETRRSNDSLRPSNSSTVVGGQGQSQVDKFLNDYLDRQKKQHEEARAILFNGKSTGATKTPENKNAQKETKPSPPEYMKDMPSLPPKTTKTERIKNAVKAAVGLSKNPVQEMPSGKWRVSDWEAVAKVLMRSDFVDQKASMTAPVKGTPLHANDEGDLFVLLPKGAGNSRPRVVPVPSSIHGKSLDEAKQLVAKADANTVIYQPSNGKKAKLAK